MIMSNCTDIKEMEWYVFFSCININEDETVFFNQEIFTFQFSTTGRAVVIRDTRQYNFPRRSIDYFSEKITQILYLSLEQMEHKFLLKE